MTLAKPEAEAKAKTKHIYSTRFNHDRHLQSSKYFYSTGHYWSCFLKITQWTFNSDSQLCCKGSIPLERVSIDEEDSSRHCSQNSCPQSKNWPRKSGRQKLQPVPNPAWWCGELFCNFFLSNVYTFTIVVRFHNPLLFRQEAVFLVMCKPSVNDLWAT